MAFAKPPGRPAPARRVTVLSTPFFLSARIGLTYSKYMNNINLSTPDPLRQQSSGVTTPPDWSRQRLAGLPYVPQKDSAGTYHALKLSGRYWIVRGHFDEVWELFWRNAGDLDLARKHMTVNFCNDPNWYDRPRGQRIALGRCIKYLAANGVLPITLANPGKSGPRKYFLNAGLAPAAFTH